jgi:Zn-dependent alcohol dehydrogenase
MCQIGTFARHGVVHERSLVKIDNDLPLDRACLVACGVTTGWGSAVNTASVRPGDDVAVVGVGGVGMSAVQGARLAGARRIFAIDPVEFKRDQSKQFGASHVSASIQEARTLINDVTWAKMCDKVICTMSVGDGNLMNDIMDLAGKRGRVVLTNMYNATSLDWKINGSMLVLYEKEIVGSLNGGTNPHTDIPLLLGLYREGQLDLDRMITRTYSLEDVNQGYQDMRDGRNIRGVLILD